MFKRNLPEEAYTVGRLCDFAREEFELRVGELAEIAEKGRFELIINCEVYEEDLIC